MVVKSREPFLQALLKIPVYTAESVSQGLTVIQSAVIQKLPGAPLHRPVNLDLGVSWPEEIQLEWQV